MRKAKEITTKTYRYDDNSDSDVLIEEIEQYYYDNEEEKNEHSKNMKFRAFKDSGQVKIDINQSVMNPEYVWFGSYYRYRVNS